MVFAEHWGLEFRGLDLGVRDLGLILLLEDILE